MEEEQEKKQKQKEINIIGLMKTPDQFRKMFDELKRMAGEQLQAHEFQSAIQYYLKCIDMMDIGKNLLTNANIFTRACLFASLAAAYQGAWKIQKCNKFCQKAEEELLKLLSEENKEQYLKVSKFLVTLKFQHCAILSQLNMHDKALETCKSTLLILQQAISIINAFSRKQEESFNSKCSDQGVSFSRKVYGFAGQILANLTQQLSDNVQAKQSKSSTFYFWQRNPQKNEQQLKKTFLPQNNSNSRRSILGVNKQSHWVDEFNIGSIMRMGELKTQTFEKTVPMQQFLFKDKLYELVIHCSLAFFTIATQMRFIDSEKTGQMSEMKNEKQLSKIETIKKKYGYQQKSETFKMSEAYHLRSIEIISSNIQSPIPYLTHMIKSYDKHYVFKKKLEEIVAINDESVVEASSIVNPNSSNINSKIVNNKMTAQERDYGDQIVAINRQTTQQDEPDNYNDYNNHTHEIKNSKPEDQEHKKRQKNARNTAKLFLSQQAKDDLKDRAKSVGRLRKQQPPKHHKQEQVSKTIQNFISPPKPKRKKLREKQSVKQSVKQDKFKKTRIKLAQLQGQGELHVRTKSSTHIKFVFKKKK